MTRLIDTHIHLDLLEDSLSKVNAALRMGVDGFVIPGTRIDQWPGLMKTVAAIPQALAAPGVHPMGAGHWQPQHAEELCRLLDSPRAIALGEVGLDRQVDVPRETQEAVFRQMIQLACTMAKPLLIHSRGTTGRLLEILREERADRVGGIYHAFNGSLETARQVNDLGFALGIGGVVTYPEARRLPTVVSQLTPEWLVLESDAPDMPPHPHRGTENQPAYLTLVAGKLAELRGWGLDETARITTENARRILRLA